LSSLNYLKYSTGFHCEKGKAGGPINDSGCRALHLIKLHPPSPKRRRGKFFERGLCPLSLRTPLELGWQVLGGTDGCRNFTEYSFFYRAYLSNVFQTTGMLNMRKNPSQGINGLIERNNNDNQSTYLRTSRTLYGEEQHLEIS
jgi:hypothetical protein